MLIALLKKLKPQRVFYMKSRPGTNTWLKWIFIVFPTNTDE